MPCRKQPVRGVRGGPRSWRGLRRRVVVRHGRGGRGRRPRPLSACWKIGRVRRRPWDERGQVVPVKGVHSWRGERTHHHLHHRTQVLPRWSSAMCAGPTCCARRQPAWRGCERGPITGTSLPGLDPTTLNRSASIPSAGTARIAGGGVSIRPGGRGTPTGAGSPPGRGRSAGRRDRRPAGCAYRALGRVPVPDPGKRTCVPLSQPNDHGRLRC
jgi:hypothetical protein